VIASTFDADALAAHVPELLTLPQWVNWRVEVRTNAKGERKPTKIPVDSRTGSNADSQRSETWGTFDSAVRRGARDGIGIGFVFRAGGGIFGLDLDKCLDAGTHVLDAWALAHVRSLRSYTEITPSGRGLHVLGVANLPVSGRRKGPLELYCSGRFFTMTGKTWPGSPGLRACQSELDALYEQVFGAEVRTAANRVPEWQPVSEATSSLREKAAQGRIRRTTLSLLDSTGGDGYESASEADAALAAGLIGAGLTESEALALFRSSTRGADAFKRKGTDQHGEYYLRLTVANAASFVGPVVERPEGLRLRYAGGALPLQLSTKEAPSWRH